MKNQIIECVLERMKNILTKEQNELLKDVLTEEFNNNYEGDKAKNESYLSSFLNSKNIEGCSNRTIRYYKVNLDKFLLYFNDKNIVDLSTEDIRKYLVDYENNSKSSKLTLDNIRRVISSFYSWLEDEGIVTKSPVRRIKKIKYAQVIKNAFSEEEIISIKENCNNFRDLCIVDFLLATGVRIGELVNIKVSDINFSSKECLVTGKGNKQRKVYFDSVTKMHLKNYLKNNPRDSEYLFLSLNNKHKLCIRTIETILTEIGIKASINNVHPHRFRRTLATKAIDKGMPIEQVKVLLGHSQIETTLRYAVVNEKNVKNGYGKYLE